jgi:mannitol/fructose-specific phosphotransferase system IIA component (Ntr-type)
MAEKKTKKEAFLTYKGKPLVRSGNIIYYGNMYDKYVVMLQIMSATTIKDTEAAGKILVQLVSTDEDLRARDRIIKKTEKEGFYNAIDIGSIWLERALAE